jgi:hypothetical protein
MPPRTSLRKDDLDRLIASLHSSTIDGKPCLVIRAWLPNAVQVDIIPIPPTPSGSVLRMTRLHEACMFEAIVSLRNQMPPNVLQFRRW